MASIINASPTNGIVQTADGSGVLKCQANGVTTNALAWVNFNGTGTVAIRSSYNVSSITDNGTGDYTVNFATALADANYVSVASGSYAGSSTNRLFTFDDTTRSTTQCRLYCMNGSASQSDTTIASVAIFGN